MRRPVYPPPHFVARRDARKKIRDEMKRWRVDRLLLADFGPRLSDQPRLPHLKTGTAYCCRIEARRMPCQVLRMTYEAGTGRPRWTFANFGSVGNFMASYE